jgi:hypothetical protein
MALIVTRRRQCRTSLELPCSSPGASKSGARWLVISYVDLDLSAANRPSSARLALGSAVIKVTDQTHLGCANFAARFGQDG